METKHLKFTLLIALAMLIMGSPLLAQDEANEEEKTEEVKVEKVKKKLARPAYESAYWFDGQTGVVYNKNTLEFAIQHRFGLIGSSPKELLGLYGPSTNTRLGLSYVPLKNLSVGLGYTKNKYIVDLNAKYSFLNQTKDNSMPVSMAYYVNMGIEVQEKENYESATHRLSYFHNLIITRRFNKDFSAHLGANLTHYNKVTRVEQEDGTFLALDNNSLGLTVGARYKISSTLIIMAGYDTPLTQHPTGPDNTAPFQPLPSINVGLEIATSNHAFQIIFTNYSRIQPQENFMYNQNDFQEGSWLIGFNITRLRSL